MSTPSNPGTPMQESPGEEPGMAPRADAAPSPMVVGFWRRAAADLVDAAVLAGIGIVLGLPLGSTFRAMGSSALLVGLVISLGYYTAFHSGLGRGGTPGKRALRIEVRSVDGSYLSPARSLVRALLPALLCYASLYQGLLAWLVPSVASALAPVWLAGQLFLALTCYLMVPLHPWKRGLHDLAAGSVVVYRGRFDREQLDALGSPARERLLLITSGLIAVLLASAMLRGGSDDSVWSALPRLNELSARVNRIPGLHDAGSQLADVHLVMNGKTEDQRILTVSARLDRGGSEDAENKPLYNACFGAVRESLASFPGVTHVRVALWAGWSIGIWSEGSFSSRDARVGPGEGAK